MGVVDIVDTDKDTTNSNCMNINNISDIMPILKDIKYEIINMQNDLMDSTEHKLNHIEKRLINIEEHIIDTLKQNKIELIEEMNDLKKRIVNLECNNNNIILENIEKDITHVRKSTKNMDEHIDFVENVYSVIKNPFTSILKLYYSKNNNQILKIEELNEKRIKNE